MVGRGIYSWEMIKGLLCRGFGNLIGAWGWIPGGVRKK